MTKQEQNIEYLKSYKTDTVLEEYKDLKILTHTVDIKGEKKPAMMVWMGKQKDPFYNYYLSNAESANKSLKGLMERADGREKYKADKKAEKKSFIPEFEIGDIFSASWGYEQTQCDFYQVIKKVGKHSAIIREISYKTEEGSEGHDCCRVLPVKDAFLERGEEMTKRVGKYGIKINSFATASKWSGTSQYKSWYY